jgi:serine/threonine-protein kinase
MVDDYSWLSFRRATDADLDNMDGYTLDVMRNSIFARHGRRFVNPGLQQYFDKQSWYIPKYSPQEFPSNLLSDLERRNVEYISEYQNRTNKRFFMK